MGTESIHSGSRPYDLLSSEVSRRGLILGAGGVGLAAFLAACAKSSSGGGGGYQTLNVAIADLGTQSPDPMAAYSQSAVFAPIAQTIGEPLVRRGYDGKPTPALATSWTISPDDLTWTFNLRSGVKMHDGSAFTSRDVETSIKRAGDKHNTGDFVLAEALVAVIKKVDLIDDLHIAVTTTEPFESMLDSMPIPIATDYYNRVGDARFRKAPVAAGQFKFSSQVINQSMTLTRFDDFWDVTRKPNFTTLKLVLLAEESTRVAGLRSGTIDAATALSPVAIKQLQNVSSIRLQTAPDAELIYMLFAATNPNKPTPAKLKSPTHDARVRQAMVYALDRVNIAKTVLGGGAQPLATFSLPATVGYDPANVPFPFDPDKAKQLLSDAGATGFSFTLVSKSSDQALPAVQDLCLAIVSNWKDVGINAKYEPLEAGLQASLQDSWTFDGGFINAIQGLKDYDPSYFADQFFDKASGNLTVSDPKLNDYATKLRTTIDPTARAALAKQYDDYLYVQQPILGLFRMGSTLAIGPHVKQWKQQAGNGGTGPFWGLRAN